MLADVDRAGVIAHLSDLHLGAHDGEPEADLSRAIERLHELGVRPDAVLLTGDLAEHAMPEQYARAREAVAGLGAPVLVLAGNHDDPGELRAAFPETAALAPPGEGPLAYAVAAGGMRVVACHSAVPGRLDGELGGDQLRWLDGVLADDRATPTIVAMHHPPVDVGMAFLDEIGLAAPDRAALAEILRAHPQVRRVVAGHVHFAAVGVLGERPVLTCPSPWRIRARLRLDGPGHEPEDSPGGLLLHALAGEEIVSHVVATVEPGR